ncbi:MAG: thrombospondin type 3 repeat-containing protein [Candidatus Binatia bacterium]|nr:thrombospondin type 3 repeat-containing protein [Candidatus Binatia bacterium]
MVSGVGFGRAGLAAQRRRIWSLLATLWVLAAPMGAAALRYDVLPNSSVTVACTKCVPPTSHTEPVRGSFDVTSLIGLDAAGVVGITSLELRGPGVTIKGNGFWQRLGLQRQAMVLDVTVNGRPVRLTSGHRQRIASNGLFGDGAPQEFSIVLSSGGVGESTYVVVLFARRADETTPDEDHDGVPSAVDNCPAAANSDQLDADGDGLGDACDQCAGTPLGSEVGPTGCSLEQSCPCAGPRDGERWASFSEYGRCVARALRRMQRTGKLPPEEARARLKRALRSGCGRVVVASLG